MDVRELDDLLVVRFHANDNHIHRIADVDKLKLRVRPKRLICDRLADVESATELLVPCDNIVVVQRRTRMSSSPHPEAPSRPALPRTRRFGRRR